MGEARQVAVTEIIAKKHDDVRLIGGVGCDALHAAAAMVPVRTRNAERLIFIGASAVYTKAPGGELRP